MSEQANYEKFQQELNRPITMDLTELHKTKPVVQICTPAYGGMYYHAYYQSMMDALRVLGNAGIQVNTSTITNESLITRGRNILVAMFLAQPTATHLLFIDADIGFKGDYIVKMLWDSMRDDVDIITGAYPKKGINWESVVRAVKRGECDARMIEKHSNNYAINFKSETMDMTNGLIELHDAPTGFMMIKRSVFERMIKAYPQCKYDNDVKGMSEDVVKNSYAFFDTGIEGEGALDFVKGSRRYLSEDYYFSRLAQNLGIKIWLDPRISLVHMGTYAFNGDVSKLFSMKEEQNEKET